MTRMNKKRKFVFRSYNILKYKVKERKKRITRMNKKENMFLGVQQ